MITLICIFLFLLATLIFIQTNVELWEETGKDMFSDMKSTVKDWYKNTRFHMWRTNRKNGVKILSDRQYRILQREGKLKGYIIVKEDN